MYLASAQRAFPKAKTWICPGVESKCPGLRYDGLLGDLAPFDWLFEIDQVLVRGTRIMREIAMFHRASRTLILVDLIENFTDSTPHTGGALRFLFKYWRCVMWNNPRPAPEYRMGWSDRQAAASSLRRILAWEFERIVLSHGDLIESNAHAVAATAWAGILSSNREQKRRGMGRADPARCLSSRGSLQVEAYQKNNGWPQRRLGVDR